MVAPTKPGASSRRFSFRYDAEVKSAPAGAQHVDLWVPVAQDAPFQTVKLVNVTGPAGHAIQVEPTLGNKIFHVRVPASSLPLSVRFDYEVERREQATDLAATNALAALAPADRERYLAGTKLVPVGESLRRLDDFRPTASDPVGVARQAYDHVLEKMRYGKPEGGGWGNGSTEWACSAGVGNCTDFHAWFMSLTRDHGVPSRFLMGIPLPPDQAEGEVPGYHCWAEFFADGRGWIPVDISEADKVAATQPTMVDFYFGGLTKDRVEFSAGRDVPLVPASPNGTRNFFIYPYAEIDGKEAPKEVVTRRFSFKNL